MYSLSVTDTFRHLMCEKYEYGKIIQFEKLNGHSHAFASSETKSNISLQSSFTQRIGFCNHKII